MSSGSKAKIHNVAVIGAGIAGRDFSARCLRAGADVVLEDVLPSRLRLARTGLPPMDASTGGRLRFASTVEEAVRDADIAIDFVPDELESKLEIFCLMDRMAPPRTILCTPTLLSIADLASCTYRPERCVSLHGDLSSSSLQLVRGRAASLETLELTSEWLSSLGYEVAGVDDAQEPMLMKNLHLSRP